MFYPRQKLTVMEQSGRRRDQECVAASYLYVGRSQHSPPPLLSLYTPRDLIGELNKDVQDTKTSLRRAEALAEERRVLLDERQVLLDESRKVASERRVLLDESRKVASAYKAELEQLRAEASEFRRSKQE